jgi:hypothetical protein
VEYAHSFSPSSLLCDPVLALSLRMETVYIEQAHGKNDIDPDLFATHIIEMEWKPDGDRALIYKDPLPELRRHDPQGWQDFSPGLLMQGFRN